MNVFTRFINNKLDSISANDTNFPRAFTFYIGKFINWEGALLQHFLSRKVISFVVQYSIVRFILLFDESKKESVPSAGKFLGDGPFHINIFILTSWLKLSSRFQP